MTRTVTVTVELTPEFAAGLKRFADKVSHSDAMSVLYAHLDSDIRSEQASHILAAFDRLGIALTEAGARSYPWIETGCAE